MKLYSNDFNEDYYKEHKISGLDYLGHGFWQKEYAKMISNATLQTNNSKILDIGCACGSILLGFKKLNYDVIGIDLNSYMIELGRKHFHFSEHELKCASAQSIPVESGSVNLVHSAQVFEHINEKYLDTICQEMKRVMTDDAYAFIALDAIRNGETKEQYMYDPTHCTLKPTSFWDELFYKHGFVLCRESYDRYAKSDQRPTANIPKSFFFSYNWSVWILRKIL